MNHHNHNNNHHHDDEIELTQKPRQLFKDYIPLIVIFLFIILITIVLQLQRGYVDLMFAMQSFMGSFFVIFGGFKLIKWRGFVEAYRIYDIIAKRSRVYAYAYPLIELALGVAFLLSFQVLLASWITLIVMIISSIGVYREIRKKNQIPCACLGVVFKLPMTKVTFFEDMLMAVMALIMIILL